MGRPPVAVPDGLLAELAPTLRLATALTGSTTGAAELVADVLARDCGWAAAEPGFDPNPRLRVGLVRTFLASPLGRSNPRAAATGLDALPGPARAAVVLRDGERLTGAEIASIMDRPGRRVAADLAVLPPGEHRSEIVELDALAPSPGTVASFVGPAARRVRRRRHVRASVLAAAAVALVAAVAVPTVVLPRLPVEVREPGTWRYSHEVALATGWELRDRSVRADAEMTGLRVPGVAGDEPAECTVLVRVAGEEPDRRGDVEPAGVRGRRAELVSGPGTAVSLNWEYAPAAWASAECQPSPTVTADILFDIAAAVRFRDTRQLLPFTLRGLPEGYRIEVVGESFTPRYGVPWGPTVLLAPPENSYQAAVILGPDLGRMGDGSFDANGRCLGPGRTVCVYAFQTDDQVPPNRGVLRRTVATTIDNLRLAPDPADRSTWFDAVRLPG